MSRPHGRRTAPPSPSRALLALALAASAGACSEREASEPERQADDLQRAIAAPQDRARAVEAEVMQARQRTDEAVDAATDPGGDGD